MTEHPVRTAPARHGGQRVVAHPDSVAARWIGALALLAATSWLAVLLSQHHDVAGFENDRRLFWSLTVLIGVGFIARGIFLGRPVTAGHAGLALVALLAGLGCRLLSIEAVGDVLVVVSALILMWPTSARPQPDQLPRVWALVSATTGDPLAPFAMQESKSYHFTADGTAALAYRTRLGYAVVSGDPLGAEARFPDLVADFAAMCHARGWRIAVLGAGERRLTLWTDPVALGQSLRAVPIGRDVVIDVVGFGMAGRRFRNLRQAVARTHNAGITTAIVDEQGLDPALREELVDVVGASPRGAHTQRGFSMILDGTLEGRHPGMVLALARDRDGVVQGFHRYARAGGGSDITLDIPWRRRGAPNGIDERLTVDMIDAARNQGAQRLSLAFAAFPELFDNDQRPRLQRMCYGAIHLGDPLIALESLYRYLRKFHALGARRFVLLSLTQLVPVLIVLLSLEFLPRRRRLS